MTSLRYRAWTKATAGEAGTPRHSANWVDARRAWLKVYDDRIECGNWVVPSDAVEEAVLYHAREMGIPVTVLSVTARGRVLQFGFNPWARIAGHLPFPFREENVRLGYSGFSIAVRLLVLLGILYWLWPG